MEESSIGADKDIVKELVAVVYDKVFSQVEKILNIGNEEAFAVMIPQIVNAALDSIEQEKGEKFDGEQAMKAISEIMLMLTQDAVKAVLKKPIAEATLQKMMRNMIVDYVEGHEDVVPKALMDKLMQAGKIAAEGQPPQGQPQGLLSQGAM